MWSGRPIPKRELGRRVSMEKINGENRRVAHSISPSFYSQPCLSSPCLATCPERERNCYNTSLAHTPLLHNSNHPSNRAPAKRAQRRRAQHPAPQQELARAAGAQRVPARCGPHVGRGVHADRAGGGEGDCLDGEEGRWGWRRLRRLRRRSRRRSNCPHPSSAGRRPPPPPPKGAAHHPCVLLSSLSKHRIGVRPGPAIGEPGGVGGGGGGTGGGGSERGEGWPGGWSGCIHPHVLPVRGPPDAPHRPLQPGRQASCGPSRLTKGCHPPAQGFARDHDRRRAQQVGGRGRERDTHRGRKGCSRAGIRTSHQARRRGAGGGTNTAAAGAGCWRRGGRASRRDCVSGGPSECSRPDGRGGRRGRRCCLRPATRHHRQAAH